MGLASVALVFGGFTRPAKSKSKDMSMIMHCFVLKGVARTSCKGVASKTDIDKTRVWEGKQVTKQTTKKHIILYKSHSFRGARAPWKLLKKTPANVYEESSWEKGTCI